MRLRWLAALTAWVVAWACSSSSTNIPATTGGTGGGDASATGGTGGTSDAKGDTGGAGNTDAGDAAAPCPDDMVDMGDFCIDKVEVSNEAYEAFLGTTGNPGQGPPCDWNTSFAPATMSEEPACSGRPIGPKQPVSCVDWCDAKAFCEFAGGQKRLCGLRGGGGATTPMQAINVQTSEWFYACSNGSSQTAFPYGIAFVPGQCVDDSDAPSAVGTTPGCVGMGAPFDQLHDMSGNVSEWTDTCDAPAAEEANTPCLARGGGFIVPGAGGAPPDFYSCAGNGADADPSAEYVPRKYWRPRVGFRCCKDRASN